MAKFLPDAALDATLDYVAGATEQYICTSQPVSRAAAITASLTGAVTLASGDFTKADDTSGRKVTVAQKADIAITATGDANHIVLCDATNIRAITTCTTQTLTSGGTVTRPAFTLSISDPT